MTNGEQRWAATQWSCSAANPRFIQLSTPARSIARGEKMKERKAFLMRIDPALWAELESWAQAELRSVNGQIEMILRQAVQKRKGSNQQPKPLKRKASA